MANHGYVIKCKNPYDMQIVGELAERFVNEKMKGLLSFIKGNEFWMIFIPGDKYDGIQFWVGTYGDEKVIEIQHRHSNSFWWWVDGYLANYLATELGGRINDDGFDKELAPDLAKYENLDKYRQENPLMDMDMPEYFNRFPQLKKLTKHPKCYKKTLNYVKQSRERWVCK